MLRLKEGRTRVFPAKKCYLGSLAALVILILAQVVSQLLEVGLEWLHLPAFIAVALSGLSYIGLTYSLLKVLVHVYLKRDLAAFGLGPCLMQGKWLLVGLLLPLLVSLVYFLLPGHFYWGHKSLPEVLTVLSRGIFFTGFGAGFVEEMVFRGLIMTLIRDRWGTVISIFLPSFLFALLHLIGENFTLISLALVLLSGTVVGSMFSLIAYEGGHVWNNALVHSLWNSVIISGIIGISPHIDSYNISHYVLEPSSILLTGGQFGIEASLIALLAYSSVALYAWLALRRKAKR
ncbi:CPBP family intramembrane glutamic endopeptidase [Streptococcus halichoeri]|uniref:CPBP family intramembrane glutamic endopeptidase n=1 Tax=Streptococcus halichoeri TaxID=254785 RepID=UPI001F16AE11|nr:CPBP family intramembrane glutamic endopeptidase [Streptococcus halichoeri]